MYTISYTYPKGNIEEAKNKIHRIRTKDFIIDYTRSNNSYKTMQNLLAR